MSNLTRYAEVRDGKVVQIAVRSPDFDHLIRKINGEPVWRPIRKGEGHDTPSMGQRAPQRSFEIFTDHVVEHLHHEEVTAEAIADAFLARVNSVDGTVLAALRDFDRRLRLLEQKGRISDAQFRAYLTTLLIESTPNELSDPS